MALWPFGRKKRKVRSEQRDEKTAGKEDDENLGITTRITADLEGPRAARMGRNPKPSSKQPSRMQSKTREPENSDLPTPPLPPASFAQRPSRSGSTGADAPNVNLASPEPAPASSVRLPLSELNNVEQVPPSIRGLQASQSKTSLQPERFTVATTAPPAPTLRPSRTSSRGEIPRRKSSKRTGEERLRDKEREKEIRSMTEPIPIPRRPRSYTGGLLSRDSKRIPKDLKSDYSRPASEVSLPLAESLRSSIPDMPELSTSFRINAFTAAFAPRPSIKPVESSRQATGSYGMSRASTRRGPTIPEEEISPRARVDDLAEDMDATRLRELLETDKRRKERRKKSDKEKLERRLQRKLEKQKAAMTGDPGPSGTKDIEITDADKKERGRSAARSGRSERVRRPAQESTAIEKEISAPASGEPGKDAQTPKPMVQDPTKADVEEQDPFDESAAVSPLELGSDDERETPILEVAREVRLSAANLSPPSSPGFQQPPPPGPSGLSNVVPAASTEETKEVPETSAVATPTATTTTAAATATATTAAAVAAAASSAPSQQEELPRRDSEQSARAGSSWRSFFRRGTTTSRRESSDKGRGTPSEFSNTSRESFTRKPPPPPPVPRSYAPKDGVPKRTRSKFREDLPELPISPRNSKIQPSETPQETPQTPQSPRSPQAPASPYIDNAAKLDVLDDQARATTPLGDVHPAFRGEVSASRQSIKSDDNGDGGPSVAELSRSLASVDSEGSWLSGKPHRASIPISVRQSVGSQEQIQEAEPSGSYFERRVPTGDAAGRSDLTSQLRPESYQVSPPDSPLQPGEEAKVATVHEGKALLVQRPPAFKSREGLLEQFDGSERYSQDVSPLSSSESEGLPPKITPSEEVGEVHHATASVGYGKHHARAISVGSARMLDIAPRSSTEQKRISSASSQQGSPLAHFTAQEYKEEIMEEANPGLEEDVEDTIHPAVEEPVEETKPLDVQEPAVETKPLDVQEPVEETKPLDVQESVEETKTKSMEETKAEPAEEHMGESMAESTKQPQEVLAQPDVPLEDLSPSPPPEDPPLLPEQDVALETEAVVARLQEIAAEAPQKVLEEGPKQTPIEIPTQEPIEPAKQTLEETPKSTSEEPLATVPKDTPMEVSEAHKEAPQEVPKEAPKEEIPEEASREAPKEAPREEMPKEATMEAPKETSPEAPKETPQEMPKQAPKEIPQEMPKEAPVETPKETPQEISKEMPKESTIEAPKEAPKETSQEAPQSTFVGSPLVLSTETPKEAPKETAKEVPQSTSGEPAAGLPKEPSNEPSTELPKEMPKDTHETGKGEEPKQSSTPPSDAESEYGPMPDDFNNGDEGEPVMSATLFK